MARIQRKREATVRSPSRKINNFVGRKKPPTAAVHSLHEGIRVMVYIKPLHHSGDAKFGWWLAHPRRVN